MHVAIVGTGISGLVTAHRLSAEHRLTLFESGDHVGGHAWTVDVDADGASIPVDVGFMVFNETTYPTLTTLFRECGVASRDSDMSFAVRCHRTGLEWCGTDLSTVFAWKRNALRPGFVRMLFDVLRFNREAARDLDDGMVEPTLEAYLDARGYSTAFRELYLLPMAAAVWSSPVSRVLDFPAEFLIRFFSNHGLLTVDGQPQWRTVEGGSKRYVEALSRPFADRVRLRTPVCSVRRTADAVEIGTDAGTEQFDHVVFACHSDQALAVLRDPSAAETEILGSIPYQSNDAVLHRDETVLPRRRRARASWNAHRGTGSGSGVAVTYDLSRLQGQGCSPAILLTLNAPELVDPSMIVERFSFSHPVFSVEGERAKSRHDEIDGTRRTSYCGAYWRNGFHEDGAWSADRSVRRLRDGRQALRTVA